ncbi:hypothetical protein [Paractinoplanes globisporus]|uniref:Uncharacterized protein n=1 Tax=Paractinoplanes globisporus TaxID=113565 RepID=A0ABW6WVY7_9ACTN|nr:hypothetical protein [Actinoplanes globisporus]
MLEHEHIHVQAGPNRRDLLRAAALAGAGAAAFGSATPAVGKAFEVLDSHGVAYSVLAGNHDVSGDDTRGRHAVPADDGTAAVQAFEDVRRSRRERLQHRRPVHQGPPDAAGDRADPRPGRLGVETVAPYFLAQDPEERSPLAAQHLRLTTPVDLFSMPIDFEKRFASFIPVPERPARPASRLVVPGTLAYWRFDGGGVSGSPVGVGQTVRDLSGRGNDLTVAAVAGSAADALTWASDHHPDQPAHAGLPTRRSRRPGSTSPTTAVSRSSTSTR